MGPAITLDSAEIDLLYGAGPSIDYPKGQLIFTSGEMPDRVYFLKAGVIKVYRLTGDGQRQTVALRYQGELMGIAEALYGGERTCCAEVVTDAGVVVISKGRFIELLRSRPGFTLRVAEILGARLREAHTMISDLTCHHVPGRVALFLLKLVERCGVTDREPGVRLDLRLTHEELAHMIGTSRSNVTSILNTFRKHGAIELKGREIRILNPERLRDCQ